MDRVTSKDGTSIAYEHDGRGPAVILVGGAIDDGSENAPLIPELAENFTVTTTLGVAGAKAATLRRTPWSARSRTCRRSSLNTVGRLTCTAHHPVVVSR